MSIRAILILALLVIPQANAECIVSTRSESFGFEAIVESCDAIGTFSLGGMYEGRYEKLTFQYPKSWRGTFTTFHVDGNDYCTSQNPKNCTLADDFVTIKPELRDGEIIVGWEIAGVDIKQRIGFARNKTYIAYDVRNNDDTGHQVGIRVLVDTMLGHNDGAPIYIPSQGLMTSEIEYEKSELDFGYWKAYNRPESPTIVATGSIEPSFGYTLPDKFIIADWKRAKDTAWDYEPEGLTITGDSSVMSYYMLGVLWPGSNATVSIGYGADEPVLKVDQGSIGVTEIVVQRPARRYCPDDNVVLKVDALNTGKDVNSRIGILIEDSDIVYYNNSVAVALRKDMISTSEFNWIVPQVNGSSDFKVTGWLLKPDGSMDVKIRHGIIKVDQDACSKVTPAQQIPRRVFGGILLILVILFIAFVATVIAFLWYNSGQAVITKTVEQEIVSVIVTNGMKKVMKDVSVIDSIPPDAEIRVETMNILRSSNSLRWDIGTLNPGESATLTYRSKDGRASGHCLLEWHKGRKTTD